MKRLLKALRVAFEAFKMVYKGWEVNSYEKFEDSGKYLEGTVWYDRGNTGLQSGISGWNISRKGYTYSRLYKTPFEAIPEVERLVAESNFSRRTSLKE